MVDYEDLKGIPWKKNGRDMGGMDCFGVSMAVRARAGMKAIDSEDSGNYRKLPGPVPFCIVSFRDQESDCETSHVGVVLEDCRTFLHSRSAGPRKSCVERLDHPVWKRLVSGFWEPL